MIPAGSNKTEDKLPQHTLLDELAGYLASNDLDSTLAGEQHIITHFISTWPTGGTNILKSAAAASGGFHIAVSDIADLHKAMSDFLGNLKGSQKPIIGYKVLATTSSNNPLAQKDIAYVNIWERSNGRSLGNLKKLRINQDGQLIGRNNQPFVSADQSINSETRGLWSINNNGVETLIGGAALKLTQNRYITPLKSGNITRLDNKLSSDNTLITSQMINAASNQERKDILDWASGMDVHDIDRNTVTDEIRPSLGDQLNAAPAIARYSDGKVTVFTGSNEGYLHAFDDIKPQNTQGNVKHTREGG